MRYILHYKEGNNMGFSCGSRVSVLTHHNDNNRTGANLNEAILNIFTVNRPIRNTVQAPH